MRRKVKKAVWVLKNRGAGEFTKKTGKFFYHQGYKAKHKIIRPNKAQIELWEEYGFLSDKLFSITQHDIEESRRATSVKKIGAIKTANWFVPNFDHLKFGGIFTIFRFIEKLSIEGVYNRIIIYDNPTFDKAKLEADISRDFPKLKNFEIIIFDHSTEDVNELPECDLAFCTFWVSAYLLLKFNKTKRKYYFIQDYEPLFYPGGSTSALAESTYRFGFRGLVNTPGLLAAVNKRHGLKGISFVPAVDNSIYYPDDNKQNDRVRIFFYARPHNPRNAFNLGIMIIKRLLEKYGDRIEIVTAGAEWKESGYGLHKKITNLGLIKSLPEVAELYRSCDIGFVYMLSKHPSYQPFEFMASGIATVTNNNEDNLWMLKHGQNCMVSEPSPAAMAEAIGILIEDEVLRKRLAKNALASLVLSWDLQLETIWNDIRHS